jgi:hypothetical protein
MTSSAFLEVMSRDSESLPWQLLWDLTQDLAMYFPRRRLALRRICFNEHFATALLIWFEDLRSSRSEDIRHPSFTHETHTQREQCGQGTDYSKSLRHAVHDVEEYD